MASSFVLTLDTTGPVVQWGQVSGAVAGQTLVVSYSANEPLGTATLKLADARELAMSVTAQTVSVPLPADAPSGPADITVTDSVGNPSVYEALVTIGGVVVVPPTGGGGGIVGPVIRPSAPPARRKRKKKAEPKQPPRVIRRTDRIIVTDVATLLTRAARTDVTAVTVSERLAQRMRRVAALRAAERSRELSAHTRAAKLVVVQVAESYSLGRADPDLELIVIDLLTD